MNIMFFKRFNCLLLKLIMMIIAFTFTKSSREIIKTQKYYYSPESLDVIVKNVDKYKFLGSIIMKYDEYHKNKHNWPFEIIIDLLSSIISMFVIRFRDNKDDKLKNSTGNEINEMPLIERAKESFIVQICSHDTAVDKLEPLSSSSKHEIYNDSIKTTTVIDHRMIQFDSLISYWIGKNRK